MPFMEAEKLDFQHENRVTFRPEKTVFFSMKNVFFFRMKKYRASRASPNFKKELMSTALPLYFSRMRDP